jgi:hypothetical protein
LWGSSWSSILEQQRRSVHQALATKSSIFGQACHARRWPKGRCHWASSGQRGGFSWNTTPGEPPLARKWISHSTSGPPFCHAGFEERCIESLSRTSTGTSAGGGSSGHSNNWDIRRVQPKGQSSLHHWISRLRKYPGRHKLDLSCRFHMHDSIHLQL